MLLSPGVNIYGWLIRVPRDEKNILTSESCALVDKRSRSMIESWNKPLKI